MTEVIEGAGSVSGPVGRRQNKWAYVVYGEELDSGMNARRHILQWSCPDKGENPFFFTAEQLGLRFEDVATLDESRQEMLRLKALQHLRQKGCLGVFTLVGGHVRHAMLVAFSKWSQASHAPENMEF